MAEDHEPTLGEVYRLVQTVQASIVQMSADNRADKERADNTYVRIDNNDRDLREIRDDIKEIKNEGARQKDRNRSMAIALITIAIPALISVVGLILSIIGIGGPVS